MAEKAAPFRLLVITPEGPFPQETYWVNRMFEKGLDTLHLRKPGWTKEQLSRYLRQINQAFHAGIMVHYAEALLQEFALKGVHYQLPTLPNVKAAYTVSCAVHSWEEFLSVQDGIDYALISPFFNSISKKGYSANKQLHQIPSEASRHKAVALGGIQEDNIEMIRQIGLGGGAMLGAVWQSADPLDAFLNLDKRVKNA